VLERFLLAFIPLFVAIDPIGLVPMYLSLASSADQAQRRAAIWHASLTAFLVGLGFLFLGKLVFRALGITVGDFQIAGGIILLAVAVQELVTSEVQTRVPSRDFGVVPLGLPLIAGPGMLTALLTSSETIGAPITLAALIANLALVLLALRMAEPLARIIGVTGMRAFSRIVALLLAAIAVNLIRRGWQSQM
jgi:multiple antibiotic resistance protein